MIRNQEEKIKETIKSYDLYANQYHENVKELAPSKYLNLFTNYLDRNAKILDLGCGSGRDSAIFSQMGFQVVGVDLSIELLRIAKSTAPNVHFIKKDIRFLDFEDFSFNGIWASAILLHIHKSEIPSLIDSLYRILVNEGVLYLSVKKGQGDEFVPDIRYGDSAYKYWSYFSQEDLSNLLVKSGFILLKSEISNTNSSYSTNPWINIICQKPA